MLNSINFAVYLTSNSTIIFLFTISIIYATTRIYIMVLKSKIFHKS